MPLGQGAGNEGATLSYKKFVGADGQPDYATASNAVERKGFQNLPMPSKDAMKIHPPKLHNGPAKGTGLRHNHPEGAGENYVDSFITHPAAGNYEVLFKQLDEQAKAAEKEKVPSLTLEMVAAQGYRNLGLNADAEQANNMRDRLRYAGLSDDEIEIAMKEARVERLKKRAALEMIPVQRQVYEAQRMAEAMGVNAEEVDVNFGARPFHDANVFAFGTPAPADYSGYLNRQGPNNNIFTPTAKPPSIGPRHGVHSIREIEPSTALVPRPRHRIDIARVRDELPSPERIIMSNEARQRENFYQMARFTYQNNMTRLQEQLTEAEQRSIDTKHKRRTQKQRIKQLTDRIVEQSAIMNKIEKGEQLALPEPPKAGRKKKVVS